MQDGTECLDLVNGLAMKDGVTEQVLLGVGNGLAIRVSAGCIGEDAGEPRGGCVGQGNADPRLNDGVTARSRHANRVNFHAIQWMKAWPFDWSCRILWKPIKIRSHLSIAHFGYQ